MSALVTLFANILQNPQDGRARSDLKLMNHVVSFLSALCTEEENSSIRRMLSVCAEFERIARLVLEKADKETGSRRKRKNPAQENGSVSTPGGGETQSPYTSTSPRRSAEQNRPSATPRSHRSSVDPTANVFGPPQLVPSANFNFAAMDITPSQIHPHVFSSPASSHAMLPPGNHPANGFHQSSVSPGPDLTGAMAAGGLDMDTSFQQPFVPQDLWQMPMTFEWDWADMTADPGGDTLMGTPGINSI